MGRRLTALEFDEWVRHVFDHPVTDPAWHFDIDADEWDGPVAVTAQYLTRLFKESDEWLRSFSDAQVDQGLWFAAGEGGLASEVVHDDDLSWPILRDLIESIHPLFEDCFLKRCSNHLAHRDEAGASPLNSIGYMWWDIFPTWGDPHDASKRRRDDAILDVMRSTLSLPSEACRESALHGLGHWHLNYPTQVVEIVDEFLRVTPKLRNPLRAYARAARKGNVQ